MDDQTRRELAGSVVGLGGVGTAAALRHEGLNRAYPKKMKRPPFFQELKMLKEGTKGRRFYTAGMALGAVAAPGAVHSINQLATANVPVANNRANKRRVNKGDETGRRSFLHEGTDSAVESFVRSNTQMKAKAKKAPPAKLMIGNYLGGAAIGSLAGGAAHRVLGRGKMPGGVRAAGAAMTATAAGSLTLPLQSKIMNHASGGKYEATSTGVRRVKVKPKRPSSMSTQVEARASRGADQRRARAEIVPFGKRGEHTAAQVNTAMQRAADKIEAKKRGHLVATGVRAAAGNPAWLPSQFVAKYYGQDMTRAQKRTRVASVTGLPIVADIAQAGQAARMAPPELRKKTAALTYGGGQVGGTAGSVGGAYGAAALARRSKTFAAGTAKVDDGIAAGKASLRSAVGMKPKGPAASITERIVAHPKAPKLLKGAVRPLIGHGKAAAVGSLALGAIGGQAGSQSGYGVALNMEDKLRSKRAHSNQGARHGTRVAKRDNSAAGKTKRDQVKLARAKEQSAGLSMAGGVIGLGSLGATIGSKIPHARSARIRGHLGKLPVPALTVGAGLGGINAFKYADIQHKEAAAKVKKAYLSRVTGAVVRRAPSTRKGFVRQTRTRTGISTASVRGSVG